MLFSLSVGNSGVQGASREHSETAGSEVRELQQKYCNNKYTLNIKYHGNRQDTVRTITTAVTICVVGIERRSTFREQLADRCALSHYGVLSTASLTRQILTDI